MHTFYPAVAQFGLKWPTGELQPRLIDVGAQLIHTGHPDHHRRCVCNQAEALFAFTDYVHTLFMLLGEGCQNQKRDRSENQEHLEGQRVGEGYHGRKRTSTVDRAPNG